MKYLLFLSLCVLSLSLHAQEPSEDWYFNEPGTFNGISIDKLYAYIGDKAPAKKVIVAILDSGVDITHEDLRDNIWTNPGEIAGNGKDDDGNGYIDDVHGWNFLGNAKGENIINETLEVTRLYGYYKEYFAGKDVQKLSKKDEALYQDFLEYEQVVEAHRTAAQAQLDGIEQNLEVIRTVIDTFDTYYPDQELTDAFLGEFDPGDNPYLQIMAEIFTNATAYGLELTNTDDLLEEIEASYEEVALESENDLMYTYNPDFNSRKIIGDDYDNVDQRVYGNNDVRGSFAFHGTHVSGIVGAEWNDTGVRGVARNVTIMPVRVVPNGDEHDKDVANAIRYAVDNGADVINMSFGKGQAWNKKTVDRAVKYARKHDVLLVHGAGNDASDNDQTSNFPNDAYAKHGLFGKKNADNWIEVGALSYEPGAAAIAPFSNYGVDQVDVFAPGVQIYSTAPENSYAYAQGTSMASPVVAGLAAVIRGYFPYLKACEVRDVIMESTTPIQGKVIRPGDQEYVEGSTLSQSGGYVDLYKAYKTAEKKSRSGSGAKKGATENTPAANDGQKKEGRA